MTVKKKMLLVMHNFAGIGDLMVKNLQHLNIDFDAIFYNETPKFNYESVGQKLEAFFRKTFLNDREFKQSLKDKYKKAKLLEKASKLGSYENILVLNTEYFEFDFIAELAKHTEYLYGFHWDGLNRNDDLLDRIKLFKKFFVFDRQDENKEANIQFLPNFYFDFPEEDNVKKLYDLLYIGTFMEERYDKLLNFANWLKGNNFKFKISLISFDKKASKKKWNSDITFINSLVDYGENLDLVKQSTTLLDLKLKVHNGLSLRFFEALKYEKKLITDNQDVTNYNFYDAANIFILGKDSMDRLEHFMNSSYQPIDENIRKQYSFSNWLNVILNENK